MTPLFSVQPKQLNQQQQQRQQKQQQHQHQQHQHQLGNADWVVWTDGACRNNGKKTASAGVGVFFGKDNPNNISLPVPLSLAPFTNQRAELYAALLAIQSVQEQLLQQQDQNQKVQGKKRRLVVKTDSKYTINCVGDWMKTWKTNGWMTSRGQLIRNLSLIRRVDDAIQNIKHTLNVSVSFVYVRGHSVDQGNQGANHLAVLATSPASPTKQRSKTHQVQPAPAPSAPDKTKNQDPPLPSAPDKTKKQGRPKTHKSELMI